MARAKKTAAKTSSKKPAAKKSAAKKPAAKKPAAKKPAARKPAAKKPAAKKPAPKPAAKKPAPKPPAAKAPAAKAPAPTTTVAAASLPSALRQALSIAANEVLFESLDMIADDADAFLADGSLGATYQSFIGPDTFPAAEVTAWLADLAAWDPASADPDWKRLGVALELASNDVARALIHAATGAGAVPPTVASHVAGFADVASALQRSIQDGPIDEEEIHRLVFP